MSIRDGAYSRFDRINVVLEFTPTQGLKSFLSKYVDENAVYRRRSQSEDDNPPSPIQMDEPQLFRGPQSPRESGLRFVRKFSSKVHDVIKFNYGIKLICSTSDTSKHFIEPSHTSESTSNRSTTTTTWSSTSQF